jgi:AcrR family transcriptional regulator
MSAREARKSRVQRRRAMTRARLLQAAQLLIGSGESATVADIAAQGDVALASFYSHFDSKEALFAELLEQTTADLARRLRRLPDDADPAVTLAAAVRQFWAWFTEDLVRGCYVLQAGEATRSLAGTLGLALAALIEQGRQAGRFHIDSTAAAAYMIGGGMVGATRGHTSGHLEASNLDIELATQALQLLGVPPHAAAVAVNDPLAAPRP